MVHTTATLMSPNQVKSKGTLFLQVSFLMNIQDRKNMMRFLFQSIKITGLYKSQFENIPEHCKWLSEGHRKKAKGNEIIDFDSLFES